MFLEGALSKGIYFWLSQWLVFGVFSNEPLLASSCFRQNLSELEALRAGSPNISHATTTGLESAGKKQLNPTEPELIENLPDLGQIWPDQPGPVAGRYAESSKAEHSTLQERKIELFEKWS